MRSPGCWARRCSPSRRWRCSRAPVVTLVFAPGFAQMPQKMALTADLIRITFPYLFFISMTGFAGAVLNSYARFAVPALTPVFLNLTLIAGALVASRWFAEPVFALAWAVFMAGLIQLLFQIPFLARIRMLPRPRFDTRHPGVRRILRLMLPAMFGVSVSQINLLLDTVLASFLPTGSVSWLYYSERLTELPLGVFGIAIATVILPGLSREYATAVGCRVPPHPRLGDQDDPGDRPAGELRADDPGRPHPRHAVPVRGHERRATSTWPRSAWRRWRSACRPSC